MEDSSKNFLPMRPGNHSISSTLNLATNFFQISLSNKNGYHKYAIDYKPELPGDSALLRRKIWNKAKEQIFPIYGHNIFNNSVCYSQRMIENPTSISILFDDVQYTIEIKYANEVSANSQEALSLYKKFYGQLVKRINYLPIRRSYFNNKNPIKVDNVELWPGFDCTINNYPSGALLQMNVAYKVLRQDTALKALRNIHSSSNNNMEVFKSDANEFFKNCVVLTRYTNDKTYIVDSVDFDKSPKTTFTVKGNQITFLEYYRTKYGKEISDQNQPLLKVIDKKKNDAIYLIPEFCFLTGLTDEMRANFNLMKQMAQITKGNANTKINECINTIRDILNNEKCKQDIEEWGIKISDAPVPLIGRRLDAGSILMHKKDNGRHSIIIDSTDDIDRKIQDEMYTQPAINKWIVFAPIKDRELTESMMRTLDQVKGTFKYNMSAPLICYVKSNQYRDWESEIMSKLGNVSDCKLVLLVLSGGKQKGANYNELKKLLTTKALNIPSQVVLSSTLSKPKGLRSVINKVLIQICAKVGGEPWAIDKLPFTNVPTMVIGIDVYNKNGKSIVGCCGSFNNTFTRYVSICKYTDQGADLSGIISECVLEAINQFKKLNSMEPQHVLVLRDGVPPSQIDRMQPEVDGVKNVVNTKLTYIVVNKKTMVKVFNKENSGYTNIPAGTLVDTTVVEPTKYDFYLVSQKSNQGLSGPTHYQVVYDDAATKVEQVHYFCYKLCYLYYNWTGGIRIPAPCQFAKKLAFLVGDKLSSKGEMLLPGDKLLNEYRSLYFL